MGLATSTPANRTVVPVDELADADGVWLYSFFVGVEESVREVITFATTGVSFTDGSVTVTLLEGSPEFVDRASTFGALETLRQKGRVQKRAGPTGRPGEMMTLSISATVRRHPRSFVAASGRGFPTSHRRLRDSTRSEA